MLHLVPPGSEVFDQIATVLLSTSMFVGGVVGFVLDNTIPGGQSILLFDYSIKLNQIWQAKNELELFNHI